MSSAYIAKLPGSQENPTRKTLNCFRYNRGEMGKRRNSFQLVVQGHEAEVSSVAISAKPLAFYSPSFPRGRPSPAWFQDKIRYFSCLSPFPLKRPGGFDIIWWLNFKGNGQLSSVDAAGYGLWGRCLADTELSFVASYC